MHDQIPGTPDELRLQATANLLGVTVEESRRLLREAEFDVIAQVLRNHSVPATGEHVCELVTKAWLATVAEARAWRGFLRWDLRETVPIAFSVHGIDQPLAGFWKLVGRGCWADVTGSAWPYPRVPYLRVTWVPKPDWNSAEPDWSAVYLHLLTDD